MLAVCCSFATAFSISIMDVHTFAPSCWHESQLEQFCRYCTLCAPHAAAITCGAWTQCLPLKMKLVEWSQSAPWWINVEERSSVIVTGWKARTTWCRSKVTAWGRPEKYWTNFVPPQNWKRRKKYCGDGWICQSRIQEDFVDSCMGSQPT